MSKTNEYGAIGSLTGFIYQEYYFLYRLLTILDGETVSLEKVDDVGVEEGDRLRYYQLKHSINSKAPDVKRMTDRDNDLWKTLSLWVSIIKKKGDEVTQRRWIANSEFVLISNKTTDNNTFFGLVEAYKSEEKVCSCEDDRTGGKKELLKKVKIEYESDEELLEKINREIQFKKHIPENRVKDLRYLLMGSLTEAVLKKTAEYTVETFNESFGLLFNDMRSRKFVPLNRKVVLPERPMEQTFVKQLQGIDAPNSDNLQEIIKLTEQKLQFENDYSEANKAAGAKVQQQFEKDMHTEWKNIFDSKHRRVNFMSGEDKIKDAGWEVFDNVKNVRLKYDQEDIGATESNGCYYHFSDGETPQIGWRCDWETLYNGKEWTTD